MRAGRLRDSVIIQSLTETPDTFNDPVLTWSEDATVHAQVLPAGQAEADREGQVTPSSTHKVRIRYRGGTNEENRLLVRRHKTTLNGAIGTTDGTSITVNADLGISGSKEFRIEVGSELMIVTAGHGTTTYTVTRGADGSTAATHSNGADVFYMAVMNIDGPPVDPDMKRRYMDLMCTEVM